MASIGLERIWVFGFLDRNFASSIKLGLVLMVFSAVLAALLIFLLAEVDQGASMEVQDAQRAFPLYGSIICFLGGFMTFAGVLLARTTEADLKALTGIAELGPDIMQALQPSRRLFVICILPYILFNSSVLPVLSYLQGNTFAELTAVIRDAGVGVQPITFVLLPLGGVLGGTLVAVIYMQVTVLARVAAGMEINLLQLPDYCPIAGPMVRVVLLMCLSFAPWPVLFAYLGDADTVFFYQIVLLVLVLFLSVILAYSYPVVVLRNRIRDRKIEALDQVQQALLGQKDSDLTRAELLTEQMFIESRWEWPFESHVQKLVLFGILPPAGWVMAAMVEGLVS